jgi:hypothetical protein
MHISRIYVSRIYISLANAYISHIHILSTVCAPRPTRTAPRPTRTAVPYAFCLLYLCFTCALLVPTQCGAFKCSKWRMPCGMHASHTHTHTHTHTHMHA